MANKDWTDYEIPENRMTTLEVDDLAVNNEISAGEFVGKNACTAWVNFDGTTTPPTIRDSFNISDVINDTSVYPYEFRPVFEKPMDNINYVQVGMTGNSDNYLSIRSSGTLSEGASVVSRRHDNANEASQEMHILIFGGKD